MRKNSMTPVQWGKLVSAAWRSSVDGILKTGSTLAAAQEDLEAAGRWKPVEFYAQAHVPVAQRTGETLIKISSDTRLAQHVALLPPAWGTLAEISRLDDVEFNQALDAGIIKPDMERKDITQWRKAGKRKEKEQKVAEEAEAAAEELGVKQYPVILADPPWRFEPYSRETGMDRAADNHYATMTVEEIAALDVPAAAHKDAVLFLWATPAMTPEALEVMQAWGFAYRSHWVWDKGKAGTGYWARARHELLLIGTRGALPAPTPGTQPESVIQAPVGAHSKKPAIFMETIEKLYPNCAKLEMFSRAEHEGWDSWGVDS